VSNLNKVIVTRGDVRDVIEKKSTHVPGVSLQAVASELNARFPNLVGEHNVTTALRSDTVAEWIEMIIDELIGAAAWDEILKANVTE
jgi:hypothetical protein